MNNAVDYGQQAEEDLEVAGDRDLSATERKLYATMAVANATLVAAAMLAQIRDQLVLTNELIAADPAISHVIATRSIITELRAEQEEEEEEEENAPDKPAPAGSHIN